jgi:biotin carboxylase
MGYYTLAVDTDPNAVGFKHANSYANINIIDEKACLEYAKKENIDGVLTAATDYGVLTASYIAEAMGLPGIRYDVAQLIKNKYQVRRLLSDNGIDDSGNVYEVTHHTDIDLMSEQLVYPVMVKPCDGSGSRGASRVDRPEDLKKACLNAMRASITLRAEVEPFFSGKEYGVESLVVNGKIYVLGVMKKWMTAPPDYAELGHAMPSGLSREREDRIKECVKRAIKAMNINFGAVNMDILLTDKGTVHIVDVGARMGGNMIGPCIIPYGTGIDYVAALINAAVGEPIDLSEHEHKAVATRLLAFDEGNVGRLPDMSMIEKQYDVEIYHRMTEGMHVNRYRTNIDGCGYIVAKGKTIHDAKDRASETFNMIKRIAFGAVEEK